jgi:hypothetical protein
VTPAPGKTLEFGTRGGTVSDAVEVAVIVTLGFSLHGRLFGAVKLVVQEVVVAVTLAQLELVNVPQFELTVQLADQTTPAFPISFVTVALNMAGEPAVIVAGGVITTEIVGSTVMAAVPVAAGLFVH